MISTQKISLVILVLLEMEVIARTILNITRSKRSTLHLKLKAEEGGFHFADVMVGGQPFRLLLDTGSALCWVPSHRTQNPILGKRRNKYDPKLSKDAVDLWKPVSYAYVNSRITGNAYRDMLAVGQFSVPKFAVIEVLSHPGRIVSQEIDGILGLRDAVDEYLKPSFVDALLSCKHITRDVFTFRFCGKTSARTGASKYKEGDVVFGEVREQYQKFQPVWAPIISQWYINITRFRYGSLVCSQIPAAIDTGSQVILGPQHLIAHMLDNVAVVLFNKGLAYVNCKDIPRFPTFEVVIAGKNFSIPAKELIIRVKEGRRHQCKFPVAFIAGRTNTHWIFGMPFLRNFHTVFDGEHCQIGFAEVNC